MFFCMLYCIVCFSSTTFDLVSLIIGRQLVELCVFPATCHWQTLCWYMCIYWRINWLIDWLFSMTRSSRRMWTMRYLRSRSRTRDCWERTARSCVTTWTSTGWLQHVALTPSSINVSIHRVTVTWFRSISMPASFRRHLVGKILRIIRYCAK